MCVSDYLDTLVPEHSGPRNSPNVRRRRSPWVGACCRNMRRSPSYSGQTWAPRSTPCWRAGARMPCRGAS